MAKAKLGSSSYKGPVHEAVRNSPLGWLFGKQSPAASAASTTRPSSTRSATGVGAYRPPTEAMAARQRMMQNRTMSPSLPYSMTRNPSMGHTRSTEMSAEYMRRRGAAAAFAVSTLSAPAPKAPTKTKARAKATTKARTRATTKARATRRRK